jgi:nitrogen fixation protein NifU and related proteins
MTRFSSTVLEHLHAPRNRGVLESADLVGTAGIAGGGGYVMLQLNIENDHVSAARFESQGCGATAACASVLTEMLIDQPFTACQELAVPDVLRKLNGLPADKMHCAHLVISALRSALEGSLPSSGTSGAEEHVESNGNFTSPEAAD